MKSNNPNDVPSQVKVHVGDLGPALAKAAKANGRTLAAEIRARLEKTIELDQLKESLAVDEELIAKALAPIKSFKAGEKVLFDGSEYTVVEWQPTNGSGCYWLRDQDGNSATATEFDISPAVSTVPK
jgi:hypothetical protein